MRNIALRLRYDGTAYHGWQEQKSEKTVAGAVDAALSRLCGREIRAVGCGRTDAGVHAARYCANFLSESTIPAERIPLAVSSLLPPDIAAVDAVDAPEDFNAILSCKGKEYTYTIVSSRQRDPFLRNRAHFYPMPMDLSAMREAAAHFVGTHDFAAVRCVGTETKTTVRTVYYCEAEQQGCIVKVRVAADGFLYSMVRSIVGTLLYCSEGKIGPADIPRLLETRDRRLTGPTAPPQGLCLTRVWYDGAVGRMMDAPGFSDGLSGF